MNAVTDEQDVTNVFTHAQSVNPHWWARIEPIGSSRRPQTLSVMGPPKLAHGARQPTDRDDVDADDAGEVWPLGQ